MSYSDYWYGDPRMAISFRKAHKLKMEMRNEELWMQGAYFYNALAVSLSNAFSKQGSKKEKYASKPFDIFPKKEETSEEQKQRVRDRLVQDLNRWAESWNKAHGVKTNGSN